MFKNPPRAIAHKSAVVLNSFITKDRIINSHYDVFNRDCPHRHYPIGKEGETSFDIQCDLHGYQFNHDGSGINNNCRLRKMSASVGQSGIIYENFQEPDHQAFRNIRMNKFALHETTSGRSKGSWLWQSEFDVDIMHVREGGIHPWLSQLFEPESLTLTNHDGWSLQEYALGFWLILFPFTFIEWEPGRLGIRTIVPNDINNEYGFTWSQHLYYDDLINYEQRRYFAKLKDVYLEDVMAVENISHPWIPMFYSDNPFELNNVNYGKWVHENRKQLA